MNTSVQELTAAVNAISSSAGYQVLATPELESSPGFVIASDHPLADTTINSILLADIAGVYDYKAPQKRGQFSLMRFFVKTADNTQMIVRLPEEKVKRPGSLMHYSPADTLLVNNYVIALSEYQFLFNRYLGWDYKMASTITIKDIDAGALKIQSSNKRANAYHFASEFAFADGYVATCEYSTGDTAVSTYAITDGTKILYEEKFTAIKSVQEKKHREKEYSLTIGDVQIVRKPGHNGLDSAKVYVAGVLQLNSKVEIVDLTTDSTTEADDKCVTNHKRDLKITFDDGTSSTISELIGPSVDTIRSLFVSLRKVYFATSIVDKIAWNIYKNKE